MKLSDRVKQLDGPCREVDAEIAVAKGWVQFKPDWFHPPASKVRHHVSELPRYTSDLNAAMSLVPEGWSVGIGDLPGADWVVRAHLRDHRPESLTPEGHSHIWVEGHNRSFALALCAAALRARGL